MSNELATIFDAIGAVAPDVADELQDLSRDIDLWTELELDSMDHLTVMTRLAEVVGRDIPERDYPKLLTLRQLETFLSGPAE